MKIIHTGDLHIGKVVDNFSMLEDQEYILDQIIKICQQENADTILITGDIYDRSIPPAEAVTILNRFLTKLSLMKMNILIISGNHDSPERISFAKDLLKSSGVHIAGEFSETVEKVVLKDSYGEVNFYLLPFARPVLMRYFGMRGNSYDECVKEAVEKIALDETQRNVMLAHHFVAGNGIRMEESESEYPISAGGVDVVDYHCFKCFDYTALGHIHNAQRVGNENIRYAGSLLKYSFSENEGKSVTLIEMKEKGKLSHRQIPVKPVRDMRSIRGKLDELLAEEVVKAANPQDYLKVTLTDTDEIVDPLGKLRSSYPNICQLVIEKNIRHDTQGPSVSKELASRNVYEIYQEFYEKVTDCALDAVRKEVILEIIEEIGSDLL